MSDLDALGRERIHAHPTVCAHAPCVLPSEVGGGGGGQQERGAEGAWDTASKQTVSAVASRAGQEKTPAEPTTVGSSGLFSIRSPNLVGGTTSNNTRYEFEGLS